DVAARVAGLVRAAHGSDPRHRRTHRRLARRAWLRCRGHRGLPPRRRGLTGVGMNASVMSPGRRLARFAAALRFDDIPAPVMRRTEALLLDWLGSALAGRGARPVEALARVMLAQGPADGPAEVLIHRRGSSPLVAAAINAAASHVAEQDDVHNGSVFHPA